MAENVRPDEHDIGGEAEGELLEKTKLKTPRKYCVIFHNDDFTSQDFVIHILMSFFYKRQAEAFSLMLKIHQEGRARVGLYTKDVAESKVAICSAYCREHDMPLLITCEPA